MTLDPQAAAVLERAARANLPPYPQIGAPAARELYRDTRGALAPPPPEVARVENLAASGPAGPIPVRLYRGLGTEADERLPVLVYFHGGGWTIGDLDTHDVVCREFANLARCAVASVDYRLAPEHKFPAAVEDAIAATHWIGRVGDTLGLDPARVAVGGDSAGGNLAAVVALTLRDAGGPPLAMQVLIYPATDMSPDRESHVKFAEGYMLTRDAILWFTSNYLRGREDVADWRASPLRARDFAGVAPAYVITAGFDPLCDEGKEYAERLHEAGVPVTFECFEGMIHGFVTMGGVIAAAHHAISRAASGLKQAFATAVRRPSG